MAKKEVFFIALFFFFQVDRDGVRFGVAGIVGAMPERADGFSVGRSFRVG